MGGALRPRFALGAALWAAGWAINLQADHILINLRKPGEKSALARCCQSGQGIDPAHWPPLCVVPTAYCRPPWSRSRHAEYKIPRGGLFEYVSAANYFGEMVEWTGFAIASWSLPAAAFAFYTFANLAPRHAVTCCGHFASWWRWWGERRATVCTHAWLTAASGRVPAAGSHPWYRVAYAAQGAAPPQVVPREVSTLPQAPQGAHPLPLVMRSAGLLYHCTRCSALCCLPGMLPRHKLKSATAPAQFSLQVGAYETSRHGVGGGSCNAASVQAGRPV